MDRHGIEKSVICSIATKPSQFDPILEWSKRSGPKGSYLSFAAS